MWTNRKACEMWGAEAPPSRTEPLGEPAETSRLGQLSGQGQAWYPEPCVTWLPPPSSSEWRRESIFQALGQCQSETEESQTATADPLPCETPPPTLEMGGEDGVGTASGHPEFDPLGVLQIQLHPWVIRSSICSQQELCRKHCHAAVWRGDIEEPLFHQRIPDSRQLRRKRIAQHRRRRKKHTTVCMA
jgi:hypothetical protein